MNDDELVKNQIKISVDIQELINLFRLGQSQHTIYLTTHTNRYTARIYIKRFNWAISTCFILDYKVDTFWRNDW